MAVSIIPGLPVSMTGRITGFHDRTGGAKPPGILTRISVLTSLTLWVAFLISAQYQFQIESLYVLVEGLRILFEFQDPEVVLEENHQTCYSL